MSTIQDRRAAVRTELDLSGFDPIGLDELDTQAALQTRVDRKYVLPTADAAEVVARLATVGGARVLQIDSERNFRYLSTYFDTPRLDSYRLTAQRRRRRFKVRTRCYLDSDLTFLEVKTRGPRGSTVKHRVQYLADPAALLTDDGRGFVDDVLGSAEVPALGGHLLPVLTTRYRRGTLVLAGVGGLPAARVTIDRDLVWEQSRDHVVALPEVAVLETKTTSTPSDADRVLWSLGHRPIGISKFGTGMAALHPDLPAGRWHRLLGRLLAPTAPVTGGPVGEIPAFAGMTGSRSG